MIFSVEHGGCNVAQFKYYVLCSRHASVVFLIMKMSLVWKLVAAIEKKGFFVICKSEFQLLISELFSKKFKHVTVLR